jgi:tetratricopeptide (TPR) repeat protein
LLSAEGKFDAADEQFKQVMALSDRLLGSGSPLAKRFLVELCDVHARQGHLDAAAREIAALEQEEQQATGKNSLRVLLVAGNIDQLRGDYAHAELHLRHGLDGEVALHGADSFESAEYLTQLGIVLNKTQRDEEAERDLRQALAIYAKALAGKTAPASARTAIALSELLATRPGRHDEALTLAQSGAAAYAQFYGENDSRTLDARRVLASLGRKS